MLLAFIYSHALLGEKTYPAGRLNDPASPTDGKTRALSSKEETDLFTYIEGLSKTLSEAGFKLGRLQTGTPARLLGKTINFSGMDIQKGDEEPQPFSFITSMLPNKVGCSISLSNIVKKIVLTGDRIIKFFAIQP